MENKILNIMYQSDDNYAAFMGVSITSLLANCPERKLAFYIIDIGISEENKQKLNEVVQFYGQTIHYLSTEALMEKMKNSPIAQYAAFRKNKTSFCKMFFEELIPEGINKILYIDCDTVVESDIADVFDVDMGGASIGMVQDALTTQPVKEAIGFSENDRYYNSGVILFDVDAWKTNRCSERINEHAKEGHMYGTVDQDYLNVVLKDEIKNLDIQYNLQLPYFTYKTETFEKVFKHSDSYYTMNEIQRGVEHPAILHFFRFCGESPWNKESVHPGTPMFDKYLQISPWKDYEKKASNKGGIFKVEKILFKILPRPIFCRVFKIAHDRMLVKSEGK